MIIRSLTVSGENKVSSALYFERGANIIAGASDTGKSYVVQCLKFILGAEKPPKAIDESEGYTTLTVEFEHDDGTKFVLVRNLTARAPIYLQEDGQPQRPLKPKHQKGNTKNLSNYFLEKISLNDKLVLQGKDSLRTNSLSLRDLEKVFVIDETRIVAEYSPLGTGQNNGSTPEQSLLRILLTGTDDSEAGNLKKELASKSIVQHKISAIENLLTRLYPDGHEPLDKNIIELEEELELEEVVLNLKEAELYSAISDNESLINSKRDIIDQASALDLKLAENKGLLDRFSSLRSKYQSDRERLVGISEATGLLQLYEDVACPTCGSQIPHKHLEESPIEILPAIDAEISKIDFHLNELDYAKQDLTYAIAQDESKALENRNSLTNIERQLESSISDILDSVNTIKSRCSTLKSQISTLRHKVNSIQELSLELENFRANLGEKQSEYSTADFDDELKDLSKAIENVLERWDFPNHKPTVFDLKSRDLVIGGKPRPYFGKGYRAIGFSAFTIGLMQHLCTVGRHPGFVVLDSPLTTYKQADQDRGEEISEDDKIAGDMVYSFYSDIAENYRQHQIIIFDNQEPDVSLIPQVTYYHFSKNRSIGRFGFFPPLAGKNYTQPVKPKDI